MGRVKFLCQEGRCQKIRRGLVVLMSRGLDAKRICIKEYLISDMQQLCELRGNESKVKKNE